MCFSWLVPPLGVLSISIMYNGRMEWSGVLKQFVSLFAIIDPIGGVIFFIALSAGQTSAEKSKTAVGAVMTMAITLLCAVFFGNRLLWFFGISIFSFKVAGGVLIFLTGVAMLGGYGPAIRGSRDHLDSADKASVAVVPLGIPFLAGPGAITTAIISSQSAGTPLDLAALVGIIAVISVATFLILFWSEPIAALLGKTGMNVFTRLLGLLLSAISVEIIATGLKGLFPLLGGA